MKIYIMGICGTAMSHVALLLRELGHEVMGADQKFFDPIARLLKDNHIPTYTSYDVQRLETIAPDAIIVGNVITRGNSEMEFLLNTHRFPFYSFPAFLEKILFQQRDMWVVTGTHGKTTTTSLLAHILYQMGQNPGFMIGGLPRNFSCGSRLGAATAPFVIEGDEYDTAFFDKRSKFFHYWPRTLVVNNIELDHADIFRDLQDIQRSFHQLTRLLPQRGHLILNGDDENVLALLPCDWTQVHTVGTDKKNQWQIRHFSENTNGLRFDLYWEDQCVYEHIALPLFGLFNARNAAMAYVACHENGYTLSPHSLQDFRGVERRQTILKQTDGCIWLEDFGHHPTAIHATLQALRNLYPTHRLIACFEPACNTSASSHFQARAAYAFASAEEVWLLPPKAHIYSDRFIPDLIKLDEAQLATQMQGKAVRTFAQYEDLLPYYKTVPSQPTVVCAFSNGKLSEFLHQL